MADESESSKELEESVSRSEERIKDLSSKVKLTARERDELQTAKNALEIEKSQLAKENEFYKNFNTVSSKYQGSAEFQDKIKEKVLAGYDIEDATVAVLNKEGKFTSNSNQTQKENPAGGSATNQIRSDEKTLNELNRDEKRAALLDRENELADIFSPKIGR